MARGGGEDREVAINCHATIATERGRVVATFGCMDCGGPGTLSSPVCLTQVVDNLARQISVDTIVLADEVHRFYDEEATRIISDHARLLQQLQLASDRPPEGAAERRSPCKACAWHPRTLFGKLSEAASQRMSMFHALATNTASDAARGGVPTSLAVCDTCAAKSLADILRVVERTRELGRAASSRTITVRDASAPGKEVPAP